MSAHRVNCVALASLSGRLSIRALVTLLFLSTFWAACASSQATSGLTGVVTDGTGGVVAGVQVKLTDPSRGFEASASTNDAGSYSFQKIPPATYTLTFSKDGFRSLSIGGVELGVGVTETRDVQLALGAITDTVEVQAEGEATLNTTDASIGNVIDSKRVEDLPSLFRTNAAALLTLQPGVQAEGGDSENGSVTGARADTGNLTLDGMDVNDESIGQAFTTSVSVPIDSVQEVRTIVGGPDASFGHSSGAQVNLVTKSGTDSFHGSLHEYNRIRYFAANGWFNNSKGVPKPQLIRNQYGADLGGPFLKDKLFFFFDYEARRDTLIDQNILTVPLDSFRAGQIGYVRVGNDGSGQPCTGSANRNNHPECIGTLTPAQVKAHDPSQIGVDQPFLDYLDGRYPHANDLSGGDRINTGAFRFDSPHALRSAIYVGRLDYALTSRQRLFARGTWDRGFDFLATRAVPQDPNVQALRINHSRSYVAGDTWTISNSLVNNFFGGLTQEVLDFPVVFSPNAPNEWSFSGLSNPYNDIRFQGRLTSIPEFRNELSWTKGKHTLQFGGDLKFIRQSNTQGTSVLFPAIGLGGNVLTLDSAQRPANILNDPAAQNQYDSLYTTLLGHYSSVVAVYNYDRAGNPLPVYGGTRRHYNYNQYELYAQDVWRFRSDFTVSAGLRWQYHSVPYEINGFESVSNISGADLFAARVQAAAAGINGNHAAPFVTYGLGGPANHAPGYYKSSYRDFAPRLGLAYTPTFREGLFGKVFGDRKTSIRAGAGLTYDRLLNTVQFEVDQNTFLFDQRPTNSFGDQQQTATGNLTGDFRFTTITDVPGIPPQGTAPRPTNTPFVTPNGIPIGLAANNCCFFQTDQHLKTPYAITISFGVQRELPAGFLLDVNYFGRLGRRLVAVGDPAQQLNFKDPMSPQFLNDAFGKVQADIQKGAPQTRPVTSQPWFEHLMTQGVQHFFGTDCAGYAAQNLIPGVNNCTDLAAAVDPLHFQVGDLSSEILVLSQRGLLLRNTGLLAQTGSAGYLSNFGSSTYNGLLVSVRKRLSYNLVFDLNYAYAHSIDNVSDIQNNANQFSFTGQGLICDMRNLRVCRGNSDFDARHTISVNYDYAFPVGRGQHFLRNAPGWLNAFVGGWATSGIVSYHTGFPFTIHTGTFPVNFTQDAPALFIGPKSAARQRIHTENGQLQFFDNQAAVLNAFVFPVAGGTGNRNNITGPGFSNTDMAVIKNFQMPWRESQRLQFRAEAFNVFNHPSFFLPNVVNGSPAAFNLLNAPSSVGVITSTASTARQMQFALRYDF